MRIAELEVSLIELFILTLKSTMAMPQAILELADVHKIIDRVDRFTEAIPESCFPLADVSLIATHTHDLSFPDAAHFSVNHLAFISIVF